MKEKILILIIRLVISCFFLKCFSVVALLWLETARNTPFLFFFFCIFLFGYWMAYIYRSIIIYFCYLGWRKRLC